MSALSGFSRAFAAVACLSLLLACPSPGRAQTGTGTCTPTVTATPYATATATATPTVSEPSPTPAGIAPRGRFLYLSANIVRRIETAPLIVKVRLPEPDYVKIKIFNAAGEELLAERAGPVRDVDWAWDGVAGGEVVSPGVYFVSAVTDKGAVDLRRFLLER